MLGNYRTLDPRPLGSGPSGSFWKCQDIETGEVVAIKRIDPGSVMDVEAEVRALEAIKARPHFNLVEVISAVAREVDGVRYNFIVFKYLPGGSLRTLIDRVKVLHIDYARSITRQIAEGLEHLHDKLDLKHGDIKPENILFKDEERVQIAIADHRLALAENMSKELKNTIIAGGTTEYLAYEVWQRSELGKPMDMWALGVIVYAMLTHTYPFTFNLAKRVKDTMKKMQFADIDDLASTTRNPLLKATEEASAHARKNIEETIEKGVDWTLFPVDDGYDLARTFIEGCLNLNDRERLTAKQALQHEFIKSAYTFIRPAHIYPSAASGTSRPEMLRPEPAVSRPASVRSVKGAKTRAPAKPTQQHSKSRSRHSDAGSFRSGRIANPTEKLMQSEYTGKKPDLISLRSFSTSPSRDSFISLEDLTFWGRHDRLLAMTDMKIKTILLFSARAGFTIIDGKIKFVVPNVEGLQKLLQNHIYNSQKVHWGSRFSDRDGLASITEESEGGSRSSSPRPGHRQREVPSNEHHDTSRFARPASRESLGGRGRRPGPPDVPEARTSRPASVAEVPPVSPAAPAETTPTVEQNEGKERERVPSPAPSKRSVGSSGKPKAKSESRHSSRKPSPTPSKASERDKRRSRSGVPSRAPSVASRRSSASATKEKSKAKQQETEEMRGGDTVVEPPPAETVSAPPPAPENPTVPGNTATTKTPSRAASVSRDRSKETDGQSVRSTASRKNKTPTPDPIVSSAPVPPPGELEGAKEKVVPSSPRPASSHSHTPKIEKKPHSKTNSRAASVTSTGHRSRSESKGGDNRTSGEQTEQKKTPVDSGRSDSRASGEGNATTRNSKQYLRPGSRPTSLRSVRPAKKVAGAGKKKRRESL